MAKYSVLTIYKLITSFDYQEVEAQELWLAGNYDKLVTKSDNNWGKLSKEK